MPKAKATLPKVKRRLPPCRAKFPLPFRKLKPIQRRYKRRREQRCLVGDSHQGMNGTERWLRPEDVQAF